ncbi:hypothetical protein Droror1_Dr00015173 [Drosera rotundifolia]
MLENVDLRLKKKKKKKEHPFSCHQTQRLVQGEKRKLCILIQLEGKLIMMVAIPHTHTLHRTCPIQHSPNPIRFEWDGLMDDIDGFERDGVDVDESDGVAGVQRDRFQTNGLDGFGEGELVCVEVEE